MELIDKAALVAEIERRIKSTNNDVKVGAIESLTISKTLNSLISFINTLEMKEVDLEKEYKEFVDKDPVYSKLVNGIVGKAIAKYFFELGLKAQKGELI